MEISSSQSLSSFFRNFKRKVQVLRFTLVISRIRPIPCVDLGGPHRFHISRWYCHSHSTHLSPFFILFYFIYFFMGLFCHLLYNKFPFNSNNNNNKVSIQLLLKKNKNVSIQQKWKRVIKSDSEILRLIIIFFFLMKNTFFIHLFWPSF